MRDRFDKNRNIIDYREIERIVADGEEELFLKQHPQPRKFANSPGGVAFEREVVPPDWIVDYWHPLEKAMVRKVPKCLSMGLISVFPVPRLFRSSRATQEGVFG